MMANEKIPFKDVHIYRSRAEVIAGAEKTLRNDNVSKEEQEKLKEIITHSKRENNRILNRLLSIISGRQIESSNRTYPADTLVAVIINQYCVDLKFKVDEIIYTEKMSNLELVANGISTLHK